MLNQPGPSVADMRFRVFGVDSAWLREGSDPTCLLTKKKLNKLQNPRLSSLASQESGF